MDKTSLIYKVLSNAASETERKELDEWLSQSEENKIEFNDVKLLWETSKDSDQSFSKNGLSKIKAVMQSKLRRREQSTRNWVLIALLVIAVLVFTYFFFFHKTQNQDSVGRLKFDNASLKQVIRTLEDQYDVRIEFENSKISACTFTGIFYQTSGVDEVLQTIGESLNLRYRLTREGEYLVTGSGCSVVQ